MSYRLSSTRTEPVPPSKKLKEASPPPVEPEAGSEEFSPVEEYVDISEPFPQAQFWPPYARESYIRNLAEPLSYGPFRPELQGYGKLPDEAEAVARAIELEAFMVANIAAFFSGLGPHDTFLMYNSELSKRVAGPPADPAAGSSDSEAASEAELENLTAMYEMCAVSPWGCEFKIWPPPAREAQIRMLAGSLYRKLPDEAEAVARAIELEALMVADVAALSSDLGPLEILNMYSREISKRLTWATADPAEAAYEEESEEFMALDEVDNYTKPVPPSKNLKEASPPPVEPKAKYTPQIWPPMEWARQSYIRTLAEALTNAPFLPTLQGYGKLPEEAEAAARTIEREALMAANAAALSCGLGPRKTFRRYSGELRKRLTGDPVESDEAESEEFMALGESDYDTEPPSPPPDTSQIWPPIDTARESYIRTIAEALTNVPFLPHLKHYGNNAEAVARAIEQEAFMAANAAALSCGLGPRKTFRRYSRELSNRLTGASTDPAVESSDSD